jgi:membrane-associated phospholipid phosphatase/tRNA A-37 threonylcarbamoyl transferase component Bud32
MRGLHFLGSEWMIRVLGWGTVLALVVFRRWRHLFVFLGSLLAVGAISSTVALLFSRPRPIGIEIIGTWDGFSHPSRPVAVLTAALVGVIYSLVVSGPSRQVAKVAVGAVVVALGLARMYLGVDHPTDVLAGVVGGVTVPLVLFRLITPNDVFPVTYRRSRTAHLAIDDRRTEAIRKAIQEQLGLEVIKVEPFNLEGSFGSTPLRIQIGEDPDEYLFGKLYAATHMRADRWYKLGRTLLYGRLEDERPFSTVRRLVQYEDYMLRVMKDANLPVARPYGFVEITPEREYLLVTEFMAGARESGDSDVGLEVIDDALIVVRKMWDAGLAHRDIKPANVLVRGHQVLLIDAAFGEVRPSPWRQAVDLANMMIVLALKSEPSLVYERALRVFAPEDVAEAFAATSEATRPSLRRMMRPGGRNLVDEFRRLAPPHPRIKVQTWSVRRVGLMAGVLVVGLIGILLVIGNLETAGLL